MSLIYCMDSNKVTYFHFLPCKADKGLLPSQNNFVAQQPNFYFSLSSSIQHNFV